MAWDTWVDDSALQITSYVLDAIAKCINFMKYKIYNGN